MKQLLVMMMLVLGMGAFAAPQAVDAETEQGSCEAAAAPTAEQDELAALGIADDESSERFGGYWHCTAYAEGHGHNWGYDYTDIHYSHAYNGAMMACEHATNHHCHDVHCHYDHH